MVNKSQLLETKVYHKRHSPIIYDFSHKIFYIILNLNQIKEKIKTKLFSINKWNIFSIFWKNYGFKKFEDPLDYVNGVLKDFKINPKHISNISLMTIPKIMGYSFNPVSFWMCFDSNDDLKVVLAEVNNTFGERHGYLCFNKDFSTIKNSDSIKRMKIFHVSPFCEVKGEYFFRFDIDSNKVNIDIDYYVEKKKLITTTIRGKRAPLQDMTLIKYLFLYPFMTLKIIFLIHYHALNLWLKKVKYIKKPSKPKIDIT